jgi:peptidoglycan/xylan/chitin deacetylase (PgdA/CDA1 family)
MLKGTALNLLRISGAFAPFRWAHRGQALILTYHRFGGSGDGGAISAAAFDEQVRYLAARYKIVPLSQLAELLRDGREIPPRMAAITIDDGYRDAYEVAFPILRKHRAPATLFVVSEFLDGSIWLWTDKARRLAALAEPRSLEPTVNGRTMRLEFTGEAKRKAAASQINSALKKLPEEARDAELERLARDLRVSLAARPPAEYGPITWAQARELADGGVEIGSHTLTHPILNHLGDDRLREEIGLSRERIAASLGREVTTFCYPNGDYDHRAEREVERAGYRCAVSTEIGMNDGRSNPMALRRIHGEHDLAHFVQSTSGFEQVKGRLRSRGAGRADMTNQGPQDRAGNSGGGLVTS